jgi:hypothetical protein
MTEIIEISSDHRNPKGLMLESWKILEDPGRRIVFDPCDAFEHTSCPSLRPLGSANISSSVGSKSTCDFEG